MYFVELVRSTLIDFPPYSSLMVYVPSCNLRCDFCYNTDIVLNRTESKYSFEQVLHEIDQYQLFLDAVVISGGEPTLKQDDLLPFLQEVRSRNLLLKFDTNLTVPLKESFLQHFQGVTFSPKPYSYYCRIGDPEQILSVINRNIKLVDAFALQYKEVKLVLTKEGKKGLDQVLERLSFYDWKVTRMPAVFIDDTSHFGSFTPLDLE